jgi:hypothetical protein
MQLYLTVLAKTKENNPLLQIARIRWQKRSQHTFLSFSHELVYLQKLDHINHHFLPMSTKDQY